MSKLGVALETEKKTAINALTDQIRNTIDRYKQKKLQFYSKSPKRPLNSMNKKFRISWTN